MGMGKSQRGVALPRAKLRKLAKVIQQQEQERIKKIRFKSEKDRSEYLEACKEALDQVLALLDNYGEGEGEATEDESVREVIDHYIEVIDTAVGFGLQMMKNTHLRSDFLNQVRAYAETLAPRLDELKSGALEDIFVQEKSKALVMELSNFKQVMYKSVITKASPASVGFSRAIKLSGNSFEDLISIYQMKLIREKGSIFNKPFELLSDHQKIEVYDEIIKSSGRGSFLINTAYKVMDKIGKGVLLITLAMTVWDIFSSEHKLETLIKDAEEFAVGWAMGYAGEIVADAFAAFLVTTLGVSAATITAAFVGMTMFFTGVAVVVAVGVAASFVVNHVIMSGGQHTGDTIIIDLKDNQPKKPKPPNHPRFKHVYWVPMPDGALLARQLAYQASPPT